MDIVKPELEEQIQINELAKQVQRLHVEWNPDLFLNIEEVMPLERLNELLENDSIYVAKYNSKIIGYVIVYIKEKNNGFMRKRKLMCIDTLCVDEGFRGQGIGTKLLDFAKELGKKNKCTDLYLTVNPNNKDAIKFYEKFGMNVKDISYMSKI